jgi:hypothetical protein
MTRGRWKFAAILAAIVALYWLSFPTFTHRYRLTIAVETDGQVHSASSVIEVRFHFWPQFVAGLSNGNQYALEVRGQAVLVDLGARGALAASLRSYTDRSSVNAEWLGLRALNPQPVMPEGSYVATRERLRELPGSPARADLTPDNMPQFIWFKDVADQTTAKAIKAAEFAAVIGGDARLVSAQLEMTRDAIVINIDRKLPWYDAMERSQKTWGITAMSDKFELAYTMFVGGGK